MQVTARGLQDADDPRNRVMLLGKPFFDHFRTDVKEQRLQHFGVCFRQGTQLSRQREDNVMMFEGGQLAENRCRPVVGFMLTTPGTETVLARMIDELGCSALGTLIYIRAQLRRPTGHDLIRGFEHVGWNIASTLVHVPIPVRVQNFCETNYQCGQLLQARPNPNAKGIFGSLVVSQPYAGKHTDLVGFPPPGGGNPRFG